MASTQALPETHRALVLSSTSSPPEVKTIPTPQQGPGSVVAHIEVVNVISFANEIYNGTRMYPFPVPLVIGFSAIARVVALGPDATKLKPGQLVFFETFVRGRDDPTCAFLMGIHEGYSEGSRTLMRGEWRDATLAEFAKLPMENCHVLNEDVLLGKLGYRMIDLQEMNRLLVPYGGLRDIDLKPGETIIISPATGPFGSAAVKVALSLGAKVIAMGRNIDSLKRLQSANDRVEIVQITNDVETDTKALQQFGIIDAMLDISPPEAAESTHIKSGILALRPSGRISLMGGIMGDLAIPHGAVMNKSLKIKGKFMYDREDVGGLIKLVEIGMLRLGEKDRQEAVSVFSLDEWEEAFQAAKEYSGTGKTAVIVP
ncbi:alcohol dehydrogenase [Cadophora sp. MPI-SDFR-AT-0126]|nr:alcohol dehydrogenase [Leotiomycetes sp. MPI-SDFR-AT-0126]